MFGNRKVEILEQRIQSLRDDRDSLQEQVWDLMRRIEMLCERMNVKFVVEPKQLVLKEVSKGGDSHVI